VSWAGLQNEGGGTIPADVDDWDTFASLEENGWTVQVPPPWQVQEFSACPNAPERIGVSVTNTDFIFRDPRGEPPSCGERQVFAGFPRDGVVLQFQPWGDFGLFRPLPDTPFPLSGGSLQRSGGIKGGPTESNTAVSVNGKIVGFVRRYVGPEASPRDTAALDRILSSLRVRGGARWVEGRAQSLGGIEVSFLRPESWTFAGYPHAIVIDAPTPILRLRSPGVRDSGCELPGTPWIQVGRFDEFGVEIVVSDASDSFGPPDHPARPDSLGFGDALRRRWIICGGDRLRVSTFGFEDAGRPIYVDVIASALADGGQRQLLLQILNSIRIEPARS
jgi:hypothetical protein